MKWRNLKPLCFHSFYHKNESSTGHVIATVSGNNSNSCTLQIKNPKLPLPKYILMDSSKAGWPLWDSQVQFAQSQLLYQDQQCFSMLECTFPGGTQRVVVQTVVRGLRTSLVWRWPVLLQTQEDLLAFRAVCAKLKPHLPSESASDNSFPV